MNERKLKLGLRRLQALLVIAALLLPNLATAGGALETPTETVLPTVNVVSTLIEEGQYLEVGLNLDNKEGGKFHSAGVLLNYDPQMLTPLVWGEVKGEDGTILNQAKVDLSSAVGWDTAAVLPTKGADALTGKLAEAFVLDGNGYLYLSAEAARTMSLRQAIPDEAGSAPADMPAATKSGQPIGYRGKAETACEQAAVVRFMVNTKTEGEGETAITRLYTMQELAGALDVVIYDQSAVPPDTQALTLLKTSPLTGDMTASMVKGISYVADNTVYDAAGYAASADLSFVWIADGVSANTGIGGEADLSAIKTVTFYDWDGVTRFGVLAIEAGEGKGTLSPEMFEEMMATRYDKDVATLSGFQFTPTDPEQLGYKFNENRTKLNADGYPEIDPEQAKLTDKDGYTFKGWVLASDAKSHYAASETEEMEQALLDLSSHSFTDHTELKACYQANANCATTSGNADYTLVYRAFVEQSGNYTVLGSAYRNRLASGKTAARLYEPTILINADGVRMEVALKNQDVESFQFTLPGTVGSLSLNVAEKLGAAVLASAAQKSAPMTFTQKGENAQGSGFVSIASINSLNNGISARHTSTAANVPLYVAVSAGANAANLFASGVTDETLSGSHRLDADGNVIKTGSARQRIQILTAKLLETWRKANGVYGSNAPVENPNNLTFAQMREVNAYFVSRYGTNSNPTQAGELPAYDPIENVFIRDVTFSDTDPTSRKISGTVRWTNVYTDVNVAGFKLYWSRDGIYPSGAAIASVEQSISAGPASGTGEITIQDLSPQEYIRCMVITAYDANGKEYPVSGSVLINDLATQ